MRFVISKPSYRNGLLLMVACLTLASVAQLSASGAALVVTSTVDRGPGSLRWALATAVSGDTITFDPSVFPPQAPVTIALANPLPPISEGNLTLDGTGAGVIIDGSAIAEDCDCLTVLSDGNTVRALRIGGCNWSSVGVHGADNTIANNVLFGSGGGVVLEDPAAHHNVVIGNFIGTDAFGSGGLGNQIGVVIDLGAHYNTVGGDSPAERNVISGNADTGILIANDGSDHNTVIGNYVGVGPNGTTAVANGGNGIVIADGAAYNTVGGAGSGEGNVISSNTYHGVAIWDPGTDSNQVMGNLIGTNAQGTSALANGSSGVALDNGAELNTIGGATVAAGNLIAYNTWDGVTVHGSTTRRNTISHNAITANAGLGINNDEGGNAELAPPVLSGVVGRTVSGTACARCKLEFFSDSTDEGRFFEGAVTANSNSTFTFTAAAAFSASYLTATVTDSSGNTSEFSAPIAAYCRTYLPVALRRVESH
jgi:hypothetical protein